MVIAPCPKCGKKPKIIMDLDLYEAGLGVCITIQCKPFLRKPHLQIEACDQDPAWAKNVAISIWNMNVEMLKEEQK